MELFSFLAKRHNIVITAVLAGGISTSMLKDKSQDKKFDQEIDAKDKVIIVTGANEGIGLETARDLAKRGARVYMACRNMSKCGQARDKIVSESKNYDVFCRPCDLRSMESIREFVQRFESEEKRLDVLINNAGVMRCPRLLTKEGIELQLGVNHIGHFLLTNLLLDVLKKSAPSRIVVVSCSDHEQGQINTADLNSEKSYDAAAAYRQSKLANILFARELAKRLHRTGVVVNAVDPGLADTELFRNMIIFRHIFSVIFHPLAWPFMKTPVSAAQTILYVALEPKMANKNGLYYTKMEPTNVSDAAKDQEMGLWLWKASEKWSGLSDRA